MPVPAPGRRLDVPSAPIDVQTDRNHGVGRCSIARHYGVQKSQKNTYPLEITHV